MSNPGFRIHALAPEVADEVRWTLRDAYGNELRPIMDEEGGSPCRVCLRDARPKEPMLLFSYASLPAPHPYHHVGPIYIHAERCVPFATPEVVPEQLRKRLLSLHVHAADDHMVAADVVPGAELEDAVGRLLSDPRASYILVHNARPGCFACRIERA